MQYDLIIIGSGSVGAAAGYYARRAGLNVLMTDAHQPPPPRKAAITAAAVLSVTPMAKVRNMFRWCCVPSSYGMNWQRSVAKPCLNAPASLTSAPPAPLFLANVAASARAFQLEVEELDARGRDAALAGDTPPR